MHSVTYDDDIGYMLLCLACEIEELYEPTHSEIRTQYGPPAFAFFRYLNVQPHLEASPYNHIRKEHK